MRKLGTSAKVVTQRKCSECGDELQRDRKRVAGNLVQTCGDSCARARKTRKQRNARRAVRRNLA